MVSIVESAVQTKLNKIKSKARKTKDQGYKKEQLLKTCRVKSNLP